MNPATYSPIEEIILAGVIFQGVWNVFGMFYLFNLGKWIQFDMFLFFNQKQQTQLVSSIWPLNLSLENGTMAAYEGFLTSIYAGKDLFRPTFFELIAQEQLNEIFQPALRFLVDIFRERIVSPTLLTLLDSWEVFYTAFRMILEGSTVLNKEN